MDILILLYTLFYITLARLRLDWAIAVLIIALPSYLIRFSIFGLPSTMLELMIFIAFVTWLSSNWKDQINKIKLVFNNPKNLRKINYPYDKEIMLLLIIAFVATGIAGFSNNALGALKAYFVEPILLYIVILNVFISPKSKVQSGSAPAKARVPKSFDFLIYSLIISAFLVSGFAIFQKITGLGMPFEWTLSGRVTSFFEYPNAVGLYLGPIILILFGYFLSRISNLKSQVINLFIILTIILSLLSIYFAGSEGALVGVAAGLALFGLLASKKSRLITLSLIIVLTIGIFINQSSRDLVVEKMTLKDLSGEIRKQQWRETWEMFKESNQQFIFGTGLSNYQNKIFPYHQEGIFFNRDNDPDFRRKIVIFDAKYKSQYWQPVEIYLYPHNIFLNFWTELGLAGMILFAWIIGKFFVNGIQLIQNSKLKTQNFKFILLGLICAMIVIVVHGLVDVPYFKNDLVVLFWLIIGMMGIIKIQNMTTKV